MGIDPMNNISNNNKNTLCSYIILTPKEKRTKLEPSGKKGTFIGYSET
jgi:hypothetical protein